MSQNEQYTKVVVITTEEIIEQELIEDLNRLGVKGYTIWEVHGKGDRGIRSSDMFAVGNIRVEIACSDEMAKDIKALVNKKYAKNFAMLLYGYTIEV
ncbi:MAG: transcriptional regulator [Sulfurovum sp.]|nr:MAG: transcriptional regulator [Sulfurovum sp.]